MDIKQGLITLAKTNPSKLRNILKDAEVQRVLSTIGILPNIFELHAPSINSSKSDGLGKTLCGIKGNRHKLVTCGRCLKILN